MNSPSLKSLFALFPVCLLLLGAGVTFVRRRTLAAGLQVVGATALAVVVLTHVCEALHLFPGMHWGLEHSAGHYLDLACAILGFGLFPVGYLLQALRDGPVIG